MTTLALEERLLRKVKAYAVAMAGDSSLAKAEALLSMSLARDELALAYTKELSSG